MTNPSSKNQTNLNKPVSTTPTSPKTTTTSRMNKKEKDPMKIFLPMAITIGLVLCGIIGYLMYTNSAQERALMAHVSELEEAENIRIELEDQYNQALVDLEDMRGESEDLNALIDQQQAELEEQRNKIARLIRDSKKRNVAKEELANLKTQIASYISEVEDLKAQNEMLAVKNDSLLNNNLMLQTDLQSQQSANEQLEEARAVLVSEKEDLSKTVYFASVVQVKGVKVDAFKVKGNGKPVKRKVAKQINQLKVCFTTTVNEITDPGLEKFFIRVINPLGETMALEELGSGMIVNKKTAEEIRYTHVQEYEYSNDETELCFVWEPNMAFQPGSYNVEVYNKGYVCGTGAFMLK
ncbi:MAG: hypothetical protein NXI23_12215 [Bacteroidetes bacterium]|jgi:predicted RNase H-like nuclease (RuvC/YqgF family)|nr:hypothetical protein [Bacteroidota bacterium]MDF1864818.1 hypothetical protein [Saprospiraceae bacterium]